jgi:hypothetical protein
MTDDDQNEFKKERLLLDAVFWISALAAALCVVEIIFFTVPSVHVWHQVAFADILSR